MVKEALDFGFICGGAALVVLVVALGGLSVGQRAVQQVSPAGRGGLAPGGLKVHEGHAEAGLAGSIAVAGLLGQLHTLSVVLPGALGLTDIAVEIAQLPVYRTEVGQGGGGQRAKA